MRESPRACHAQGLGIACSLLALASATAVLALNSVVLSGCGCAQVGCSSQVSLTVDWPRLLGDLQGAELTMCRNTACLSVDLSGLGQASTSSGLPTTAYSSSRNPEVLAYVQPAADGSLSLTALWRQPSPDSPYAKGDVFSLTIIDVAGTSVVAESVTATAYQTNRPNGDSCSPVCQNAVFDLRAPKG